MIAIVSGRKRNLHMLMVFTSARACLSLSAQLCRYLYICLNLFGGHSKNRISHPLPKSFKFGGFPLGNLQFLGPRRPEALLRGTPLSKALSEPRSPKDKNLHRLTVFAPTCSMMIEFRRPRKWKFLHRLKVCTLSSSTLYDDDRVCKRQKLAQAHGFCSPLIQC